MFFCSSFMVPLLVDNYAGCEYVMYCYIEPHYIMAYETIFLKIETNFFDFCSLIKQVTIQTCMFKRNLLVRSVYKDLIKCN